MKIKDLKHGDVFHYPDNPDWLIVCLEVTKRRWRKFGENCEKPGLHGFYGMWYGRNPLNISAYGKIEEFGEYNLEKEILFLGNLESYKQISDETLANMIRKSNGQKEKE